MTEVGNAASSRIYIPVRIKFVIALCIAIGWTAFSVWLAQTWVSELGARIGTVPAILLVGGIAIVPGFMNAS